MLALAFAHVPGFRSLGPDTQGVGAPKKWKGAASYELYADVQSFMATSNQKSALNACRNLIKREKYKDETPESLYRRYQDADKMGIIPGFIKKLKEAGGPVDKWMIDAFSTKNK